MKVVKKGSSIDIGYKNKIMYYDVNINFKNSGGIISYIGDNGSGKSTFYKTLKGIIPPATGWVPDALKNRIAIISDYIHIPQEVFVKDIVDCFFKSHQDLNLLSDFDFSYIVDQVEPLLNIKIRKLSSGQLRLIEVFFAIISNKDILILDEAENALDQYNKNIFLETIKKISEQGILILHTSHNRDDVTFLGGDMYMLNSQKRDIQYIGKNLSDYDIKQKIMGG